jgi:hypothetical protein
LIGWAVVLDYTGLVVVLALGIYGLVRWWTQPGGSRSLGDPARLALGIGLAAAVLLAYQWLAFGHPLWPAQRYMPPTEYSGAGYSGVVLPQLDLLLESAFGMRFGLFTSAPLLLLALAFPFWRSGARLVGRTELWLIVLYTVGFFLFAASVEYGRLQFNSGVRYVVPVVPFLFLLAAGTLLRMPPTLAVIVAVATTYWSWCLAMYRDVELGSGVIESLIQITLGGPRLPWLVTLERLGYLPAVPASVLALLVASVLIWLIWTVRPISRSL